MTAGRLTTAAGALSVLLAIAFAGLLRLPLPFEGFAVIVAAVLAFATTLALVMMAPARWIWTDAERLVHAFRQRHGVGETRAGLALDAITTAHQRARALRDAAPEFVDALRDRAVRAADRLDEAARGIFYDPAALTLFRDAILRSELIEDAVTAHAGIRTRRQTAGVEAVADASREKLLRALDAFDAAFDAAENQAAGQLLHEVDVSSSVAETLLTPAGSRRTSAQRQRT